MRKDEPEIRYLFEPRNIAVIGASPDTRKIGYRREGKLVITHP